MTVRPNVPFMLLAAVKSCRVAAAANAADGAAALETLPLPLLLPL